MSKKDTLLGYALRLPMAVLTLFMGIKGAAKVLGWLIKRRCTTREQAVATCFFLSSCFYCTLLSEVLGISEQEVAKMVLEEVGREPRGVM